MIGGILAWWLASTVAGALAFPIAWRVFDRLPDRGYGLSRTLGVLLGGYLLWLCASLGILPNDPSGAVAAMLIVGAGAVLAGSGRWREIGVWLRANAGTVLAMETLFLAAFAAWAVVRGFNPEIVATEKPMELAFLNAILRSPQFPPQDPWLAGNAISYYYLGYVLLAWMTWLTGVSAGVAFNLGNALWFGLVAIGAYSVVFNLLGLRHGTRRRLAALLGPLMVLIVGNLAGVFEVMHAQHWFWEAQPDGSQTSTFWTWLNLDDLANPPAGDPAFPPNRFWFWWQGARVVNDIDLAGEHIEVIDEFPFFSFLLADNHPHVLSLPFAVLALAVALQAYRTARPGGFRLAWFRLSPRFLRIGVIGAAAIVVLAASAKAAVALGGGGVAREAISVLVRSSLLGLAGIAGLAAFAWLVTGGTRSALPTREMVLVGWLSGALAFLNTWDLPIYLALILGATIWAMIGDGLWIAVRRGLWTGVAVLVVAVLAVILWIPTFASQVGGILPNMIFPTRMPQFLIMFAVLLVPVGLWLVFRTRDELRRPGTWKAVIGLTFGIPAALWALSWLLGALMAALAPNEIQAVVSALRATGLGELAAEAVARRLDAPSVALFLSLLLALGLLYLRRARRQTASGQSVQEIGAFVVLLIGLAAALVIIPEFFYLRDSFGSRMNTVFKFWYAAWLLWAVAAAYALASPWERSGRWGRPALVVAVVPVFLGLVYTTTSLWEKTSQFRAPGGPQLDGTAHLEVDAPADFVAIRWMRAALAPGVVAEAVGGSYTQYARVSAHTGFPTVLGWDFHEYQWRGDWEPQGTRRDDIAQLFLTKDWIEAQAILEQYGITYVYVGPLERSTYSPISTRKFDINMDKLFEQGDVTIYGRRTQVGS